MSKLNVCCMVNSPGKSKLNAPEAAIVPMQLLDDIRHLIQTGRDRIAQTVNTELVLLHWHIGAHIHRDILNIETSLIKNGQGKENRSLSPWVKF
jgi:hypothetical protein